MCRGRNGVHDCLLGLKRNTPITHTHTQINQQNLIYETIYVILSKEYMSIPEEH